jgi:hypothetical protein
MNCPLPHQDLVPGLVVCGALARDNGTTWHPHTQSHESLLY